MLSLIETLADKHTKTNLFLDFVSEYYDSIVFLVYKVDKKARKIIPRMAVNTTHI